MKYHILDSDFNYQEVDEYISVDLTLAAHYRALYPNRVQLEEWMSDYDHLFSECFCDSGVSSNGVRWASDGNETFFISDSKDKIPFAYFEDILKLDYKGPFHVKDRLPEVKEKGLNRSFSENVLFYSGLRKYWTIGYVIYDDMPIWVDDNTDEYIPEVTHWMFLPGDPN